MKASQYETYIDLGCLGDQEVTVRYYYYRGRKGDYYNPPEPPEVELESIYYRTLDIIDDLPDELLAEIKEEVEVYEEDGEGYDH